MNIRKLNEHIENSVQSETIIQKSSSLPEVILDDSCLEETVWFGDVGAKYEREISQDEYFKKVNVFINRMIKRGKIKLTPKKSESLCSDGHYFVTGNLDRGCCVAAIYEYTGTVRDVATNAHLMGHLMGKVLLSKKNREKMSYSNYLILNNVLPILIEKIMLDSYGNVELKRYYKNLRKYRLKKMGEVDSALRGVEETLTETSILGILAKNAGITYNDVEDYCADVERGNDPVYKAHCYYVADELATRMYERKQFKKDTSILMRSVSVAEFSEYLNTPVLKK